MTHVRSIIFMIIKISYTFFLCISGTQKYSTNYGVEASSTCSFFLAWLFIAGLFHTAIVIMTHVNSKIRDMWVPVTTACGFLVLWIDKRPPIWRVATNILNKQLQTPDRWSSSNLGVRRSIDSSSP